MPPVVVQNDEWTWKDICHYLYEENAFDNIVISPGPGSPTCSADIGENAMDFCFKPFLAMIAKDSPVKGVLHTQFCDTLHHIFSYPWDMEECTLITFTIYSTYK